MTRWDFLLSLGLSATFLGFVLSSDRPLSEADLPIAAAIPFGIALATGAAVAGNRLADGTKDDTYGAVLRTVDPSSQRTQRPYLIVSVTGVACSAPGTTHGSHGCAHFASRRIAASRSGLVASGERVSGSAGRDAEPIQHGDQKGHEREGRARRQMAALSFLGDRGEQLKDVVEYVLDPSGVRSMPDRSPVPRSCASRRATRDSAR